jgi:serine/threonine protein kinase
MTIDEEVVNRSYQYKHGDRPLEGYTIQRAAGRGGFGEVYYALSDSGREVALKLVMTYEQIELRGISQCMNIKSPQLVTIFDVKYGTDGRPWVIMEYVSGPSLRELLDAAPSGLGVTKAAFFLREIGKGLTYLHNCGIVHRDLKPGNIFYEDGVVKIGDYGLSKAMSMTQHSGQTIAVGTLHYMAPEIGQGHYDRTIDIYALGALLYEMITGTVPFFGASPGEVLMKHLTSDVCLDGIEEPFQSVIKKSMAKNPADRFQSVQEMVEAVFGTEHVRNSVSQFSPASLTQVAGRAAQAKPASSGAFVPPAHRSPADGLFERTAERLRQAGERMKDAGDRVANKGSRFKRKRRGWRSSNWGFDEVTGKPADAPRKASGAVGPDPLNHGTRIFLSMLAIVMAAVIAAVAGNSRNAPVDILFVICAILGTMTGARIALKVIGPSLQSESKWVQRLALGAPAAIGLALFSFPFSVPSMHQRFVFAPLEVCFISALVIEWERRMAPDRRERLSVGHLFSSGICAAVLAGMLDDNRPVTAIATIVGASAAISLCSAWGRRTGVVPIAPNGAKAESPLPRAPGTPPPIPAMPMPRPPPGAAAAPPPPAASTSLPQKRFVRFTGLATGLLIMPPVLFCIWLMCMLAMSHSRNPGPLVVLAFAMVAVVFAVMRNRYGSVATATGSVAGDRDSVASSLGGFASLVARGVVGLAGTIVLIVSMLLAVAITINLPGLLASGVLDPRLPHQLAITFGTAQWPRLMIECAMAVCLITSVVSTVLLLLARRHGGGWHILRTVLAVIVLLSAAIALGRALPNLAYVSPAATPGDTVDLYFQQVQFPGAVKASVVFLLGAVLMGWPARRFARMQLVQPVVAGSKEGAP